MTKILLFKKQCNTNNIRVKPLYQAQKKLPELCDCLEIRDSNKYKKNKIKLIIDNNKKHIIILLYCIL